jgi:hypothetical protein
LGLLTGADLPAPYPEPADSSLGKGMTYGIGVGIKSDWLRTDLTVDFMAPVEYRGTVAAAGDTTAKVRAATALFNGYIDLANWHHIKPYIGAGAGVAYAGVSDFRAPPAAFFRRRQEGVEPRLRRRGRRRLPHFAQCHGRCRLPLSQYRRRQNQQRCGRRDDVQERRRARTACRPRLEILISGRLPYLAAKPRAAA